MRYIYNYTEHYTDKGESCRFSGETPGTDQVAEDDPDAAERGLTCPDNCASGGVELTMFF